MDGNISDKIKKGSVFENWCDFKIWLNALEEKSRQIFNISSCKTLKSEPVEGANLLCNYHFVRLECKFGKLRHALRGEDKRNTRYLVLIIHLFLHRRYLFLLDTQYLTKRVTRLAFC